MKKTYEITVAGCKRDLPVCKVNEDMCIAGFVSFCDVEFTVACEKALIE